jgi:hypothetical protein
VVEGDSFLIRVGGFDGARGDGLLTIYCGDEPSCAAGVGDCFSDNGSPTCDDEACCTAVCDIDRYCCDVEWDGFCAGEAEGLCGGTFAACVDGTGDCFTPHDEAGCEDQECCQQICLNDPFCCLTAWDSVCAESAAFECGVFAACVDATGSCFSAHRTPGCDDEECCRLVCELDSTCCSFEWDEVCVDRAAICRP